MPNELTIVAPRLCISQKTVNVFLLSIVYALFVVFFPWELVSRGGFPDFQNYIDNFTYYYTRGVSQFGEYRLDSIAEYFFREALWFELVRWLTSLTGDAAIALRIISFFILFIWGLFLFKRVGYGVALLFLFNPFFIDVAMSGIRNGLAGVLFIVGLLTQSRALRGTFFLFAASIHTSLLVLVVLYYCAKYSGKYFKGDLLLASGIGIAILVGLMPTIGGEIIYSLTGDRRVSLGQATRWTGGSLQMASLWIILLCMQCMSGRVYVKQNIFVIALIAWYLAMNVFIPWSYRIWATFLPVIAIAVMNLPLQKRQIFIYLYSGYTALQYLYWTKLFYYWYPT